MAKKKPRSEPQPVYANCIPCGARFMAGYTGSVLSMGCRDCAAGLFGIVARAPTVLVPLPDHPAAPATDSAAPENAPSPAPAAALLAESPGVAAAGTVPSDVPPATPPAPADAPRALRRPRPRVRRVPLYEPLTVGLRRRFRRDS